MFKHRPRLSQSLVTRKFCCGWVISVSNCEHTGTIKERMRVWVPGTEGPMSETDKFWLYAKEAILSISYAKTDEDKQGLLDLARIWTQAALLARNRLVGDHNCRAELSAD